MQSKGLIRFFAIALILFSLYQLSFNWATSKVEKSAETYATKKSDNLGLKKGDDAYIEKFRSFKSYYLDSMTNKSIWLGFTYQQCKDQQLGLGLDLKGGMNVVMQIKVEDLIIALANNSKNPQFLEALKQAKAEQLNSKKDFVTLFGESWNKVAGNQKLSTIFATLENKNSLKYESSNDEVLKFLREQADGAVMNTERIIRNRIDKFGVTNPNVYLDKQTGRISVELPGVENQERMRKILQATASLEFYETYENAEFSNTYLNKVNDIIKRKYGNGVKDSSANVDNAKITSNTDTSKTQSLSTLLKNDVKKYDDKDTSREAKLARARREEPLYSIMSPAIYQGENKQMMYAPGAGIGSALSLDTATIMAFFNDSEVRAVLPRNLKLLWTAKPSNGSVFTLVALKTNNVGGPQLDGGVITEARSDQDQTGGKGWEVNMEMNAEGANTWRRMTAQNVGKCIAIVLDNAVQSFPRVNGEIAGGRSNITGDFTAVEATDLANVLKSGKLPVGTQIIEEGVVGPTLGEKSVKNGLNSMIAALALICGFMLLYYSTSGLMAIVALLLNIIFILGACASMGTVLTMPGIAGLVLTIGMAVDANVIIYERIKEELAKGKNLKDAINDGFRFSLPPILDANVTTLISGIIMIIFGAGLILGYAWVLVIGIITSLFAAILVTRLLIDMWLSKNTTLNFYTKASEGLFKNVNFDFVGKRKMFYVISAIIIGAGLISIFTTGFNKGVDFQGGRSYVIKFDQSQDAEKIASALKPVFGGNAPVVKTYGASNQYKITTSYGLTGDNAVSEEKVDNLLYEGIKPFVNNVSKETFNRTNLMSTSKVGPLIAEDIKNSAWKSGIIASVLIALYIFLRFRKWQFSFGAVLAVIHDALVVLGFWSIFKNIMPFSMELDQTIISAVLTIMGYSMNDNVVIFDRIREMMRENKGMSRAELINTAINKTLSRTTMTAFTVLLVVIILLIFGGEVLRGFSFAMLIGLISGTYSTIFVAAPMLIDLDKDSSVTETK